MSVKTVNLQLSVDDEINTKYSLQLNSLHQSYANVSLTKPELYLIPLTALCFLSLGGFTHISQNDGRPAGNWSCQSTPWWGGLQPQNSEPGQEDYS